RQAEQLCHDDRQVVSLVVGRQDDSDGSRTPGFRQLNRMSAESAFAKCHPYLYLCGPRAQATLAALPPASLPTVSPPDVSAPAACRLPRPPTLYGPRPPDFCLLRAAT